MTTCKFCAIELTFENRSGPRRSCKPCRSKEVCKFQRDNVTWRRKYANEYARKIGRVKEYPCEGCNKPCIKKYAHAFCSDKCRFMSHVEVTPECWIWKGAKNRGYGLTNYNGSNKTIAHRLAYELFIGPIPKNMLICHACDNRSCVKPAHLWFGTHKENMLDMIDKERQYSKLKPMDVVKIRELANSGASQKKIMQEFDISIGTISSIVHRRIWKHI